MLVSLPVKANCTNIVNLMEPCYTKQYLDSIASQRKFFKTHKKCSPMKYVKLTEQCPKGKPKKAKK